MSYPQPIQNLINSFSKLPGVGQRTAERFVFYLLKSGKKEVGEIILSLKNLSDKIKSCERCWNFSDKSPCHICSNKGRDQETICVVQEPQDLQTIERTGEYNGYYHVLRGVIRPEDEESVERLKIKELIVRSRELKIKEIILALSPDLAGETTMLFLEKQLKNTRPQLIVSRLARGLPMGSDLQYADDITLSSALKNRIIK